MAKPPWWLGKISMRAPLKVLTPKPLKLSWCAVSGTYWCRSSDDHCEGYVKEGLQRGRFGATTSFVSRDKAAVERWLAKVQRESDSFQRAMSKLEV